MSESTSSGPGRIVLIAGAVILLGGVGLMMSTGGGDSTDEAGADPSPAASGADAASTGASASAGGAASGVAGSGVAGSDGSGSSAAASDALAAAGDSSTTPAMGASGPEDEPLVLPDIDWESLPESHRADQFEASLETLSDWIGELGPEYNAQLLGTDCSAPPCLVGMAFDGTSFGDDHTAKAQFQTGFSDELQRLRGQRPSMTMVTATPDGTTAVWMYELPQGGDSDASHDDLNESARVRHHQWMAAWSSARAGRAPSSP
jgi:hypothetical protein